MPKFARDGRFLLQIGHSGQSKGSLDTENLNRASQVAVWPKTNEVFISDGYVNRRVIVFDADTGKFKTMWGAYGNKPDDSYPRTDEKLRSTSPPPPPQYDLVHGIQISNDGLVYVSDRRNNRIQVFTIEGTFIKEGFVARTTTDSFGTSFSLVFSPDKEQKHLYEVDAANFKVRILNRQTIEEIPGLAFGHGGPYPGQWHWLHNIGVDSKGNIYTAESMGARVQKFIYKGMSQ